MRIPKFLSPSSLAKFKEDREEFYRRYLCDHKSPRPPQMNYMAAGSGFDARVKSAIHTAVFGESATKGSDFEFEAIFENQVEPHIRDEIFELSKDLFQQYIDCGAYGNLLGDIIQSPYAPEMEFEAKGEIEGVPLLGKPDLRYVTADHIHVIADWKVNGSCSKTGASPVPGYKVCLDYGSNTHGKSYMARRLKADPEDKVYKDYTPISMGSVEVNQYYLEEFEPDWATQLAIYSWLLGEQIGSENYVIRMEQIACRPVKTRDLPRAKFATHMSRISKEFQESVIADAKMCWATIQSGHIFDHVSREDSDRMCQTLDDSVSPQTQAAMMVYPGLAGYSQLQSRFK